MTKKKPSDVQHEIRDRSCSACGAACCSHVAIAIDKPTCKRDYGNIRWYLSHQNVSVFIDHSGVWNIEFATKCDHLDSKGLCKIYEDRPMICREYPSDDTFCVFETTEPPHTDKFRSAAEFEVWLDAKKINWRPKDKKPKLTDRNK